MTMSDHIMVVLCRDYLWKESVATLPWPARSPDLNLIEHIWNITSRHVRRRTPPRQFKHRWTDTGTASEWQALPQLKKTPKARHSCERKLHYILRGTSLVYNMIVLVLTLFNFNSHNRHLNQYIKAYSFIEFSSKYNILYLKKNDSEYVYWWCLYVFRNQVML